MNDVESYEESNHEMSITGPHPEYDCYGRSTGVCYYRCSGCGVEALRRVDVQTHCRCGERR